LEKHGGPIGGEGIHDATRLSHELLQDTVGLRLQLTRITRDRDLAADILHDAVVTALQKLQAGEISTRAQLDGYVYRVALNHFRNHQRKDKSRVSNHDAAAELPDRDDRGVPESLEKAQCVKIARELLNEVKPARDRDLLVRFYLYEETKEQLCQSFGLSELHFNRVIFRARERFRDLLKRRGLGKSDFLSIAVILLPWIA
jgi:RNA polymerase sigma-70 factor (ECF subfamily)